MELDVIRMVLPVLVMIGIGYFCNRKQIFDMNGLKGLKALLGDIMLPVMLFNAFFTAVYSVRVIVVFLGVSNTKTYFVLKEIKCGTTAMAEVQ